MFVFIITVITVLIEFLTDSSCLEARPSQGAYGDCQGHLQAPCDCDTCNSGNTWAWLV